MNYTLHQLQVFTKVVQTRSITRASEELYMTQPAVSIQLKKFQDQFEIPLTETIKKRLRVTDFGMEIYKMSERILSEVYAINYKTEAYKGLLSGRLSISVVSTGKYVMPYFLADFMKKHTGIDLIMDVTNKSRVMESLLNGDIDFALVSIVPEKLDVNEEILMENELYFVANRSFESAKNKLTKEDLEKHALIFREDGSATRKVMEEYFEQKNLRARKKIELTSNEAVKQAVMAGLGISIMPIIGIREELHHKKMKIVPAAGLPIKTKWRLIWLKEKTLTPVAKEYLEFLKVNKTALIKNHFKM
ncbi:MAG: LysR family transcriptional regulator [Bacteroidetes bacterium]|nr:LysR family transcriptional regulator [Bacteroidota bacterium]